MKSLALISNGAFSLVTFRGDLIRALAARGVRIFALAPDFDAQSRAAVAALGAEPVDFSLKRAGMAPLGELSDIWRLRSLLKRLRPDVTLSYFIKPVVYGTVAAALAGVPRRIALIEGLGYFFTPAEREGFKRRLVRPLLKGLLRTAFGLSERVLFLNPDDAQFLQDEGLIAPGKVRIVGAIGVDLDAYPAAPMPAGAASFVMVARLLREKGVREYVEAARRVKRERPDAHFTLVGGLDENPGGIGAAEVAGWVAEGAVDWTGQVADVRPWLERAAVFVLPSYREGVPRSTQEAMATGRPVITTDAPGCRETVEEGVNGLIVPVRDAGALAAAMLRLAGDPALAARMGRESRRIAEARFDVRRANAILLGELGLAAE